MCKELVMMRRTLCAALVAASVGVIAVPTTAFAERPQVYSREAPPPLRDEVVPAPRHGYYWVPGYWDWHGHRHVWVSGHWIRERHGYSYREPRWEERDGRWYMHRGAWERGDHG
jgi:hypothetical protein